MYQLPPLPDWKISKAQYGCNERPTSYVQWQLPRQHTMASSLGKTASSLATNFSGCQQKSFKWFFFWIIIYLPDLSCSRYVPKMIPTNSSYKKLSPIKKFRRCKPCQTKRGSAVSFPMGVGALYIFSTKQQAVASLMPDIENAHSIKFHHSWRCERTTTQIYLSSTMVLI